MSLGVRAWLEERYGTRRGCMCPVRHVIAQERKRGMLLPVDALRLLREAAASANLPPKLSKLTAADEAKRPTRKLSHREGPLWRHRHE